MMADLYFNFQYFQNFFVFQADLGFTEGNRVNHKLIENFDYSLLEEVAYLLRM